MSTFDISQIESASRSDLIARAEALGVEKADVLTRAELIDEIVKRSVADPLERRLARGLLGVARDLVARVVERGLHLPDAAALIRGLQQVTLTPVTPPIATVTLAEIYAGQGHRGRALAVLDEVLEKEPDHSAARTLRDKVAGLPAVDGAIAAEAPSEPPPQAEMLADRPLVPEEDVQGPLPEGDDFHAEGPADADEDQLEGAQDRVRDTLPPEADVSPTVAPEVFPATTLRAAPPDAAEDASRLTEIAPPWVDEVDRLVLLPLDATSALARWEIRPSALEEARARAAGGVPIVRIVAVTPSWEGPGVEVRDIEIGQPIGDWWVSDLPPGAVLRAAVGWRSAGGFDPLAVALDVVTPGEEASDTSRWASEMTGASLTDDGIEVRARQRAGEGRPGEGSASSSWRALAFAPGEAPHQASP
jgi:hypothetical protein